MCTRYPFLACEIFCCEVDSIFATIIENQDLLEKLFKFLDKPSSSPTTTTDADDSAAAMESSAASTDAVAKSPPRKLNILLAGYFSRVAGCFILRYMPEFMQFLKGNLGIIDSLIAKIDNTSIAEVLMRLVGADEQTITYHAECVQWLDETTKFDHDDYTLHRRIFLQHLTHPWGHQPPEVNDSKQHSKDDLNSYE